MEYRQGICGECNAEYRLSPTFAADRAKCKKCGGVVAVGPVQEWPDPAEGADSHTSSSANPKPSPVPTKSPQPAQRPTQAPPKKVVEITEDVPRKRREGPSMKEKLLARRQAEQDSEQSETEPASKTQPTKARAARPSAGATRPKAGQSKTGRSSTTRTAGSRATTHRTSSKRKIEDDEDSSPRSERRGTRQKQGMSPTSMILSIVGFIAACLGGYYVMNQETDAPEENTEVVAGDTENQDPANDTSKSGTEGQLQANATDNSGGPESGTSNGADTSPDGSTPTADASVGALATDPPTEATAPVEPSAPATATSEIPRNAATGRFKVFMLSKQPKGAAKYPDELYEPKDPAEPQLSDFEPFSVPPGVDESAWLEIMDLAKVMIDPDAGAAGTRAAIALEKKGKNAFPAIINVMLALDFADPEGNMAGDVCQRSLQNIANGRNVGWYHQFRVEPNKTAIQNARCVELLYEKVWARELREPGYFERYAKIDEMKKREEQPMEDSTPDAIDDELDALDDF